MRYIGVDPGANLGIICIDVPLDADGGFARGNMRPNLQKTRWVDSLVIHASDKKLLTPAEKQLTVFDKVRAFVQRMFADNNRQGLQMIGVLEEPYDYRASWKGKRGGGEGDATQEGRQAGSSFGVGRSYGLALAALGTGGYCGRIHSYPVTNDRVQRRMGWMQGHGRIQSRKLVLLAMRGLAKQAGCTKSDELSEDELMAFGVVRYHIENAD